MIQQRMLELATAPEGTLVNSFDHGMKRNDSQRFTVSKCRGSYPDQFQSDFTNDSSKCRSWSQRLRTGRFIWVSPVSGALRCDVLPCQALD
jgi:hypothetical protein